MSDPKRVLLITNTGLNEPGGRAQKQAARAEYLADHGWETVVGYVPEMEASQIPGGIAHCVRQARKYDVDVVYSISSPWHLQVIGLAVHLLTRKPWLAELRDPMTTNPNVEWGTLKFQVRKLIEWTIVRVADQTAILGGIQYAEDYFETTYPGMADEKVTQLPVPGFVPGKFEGVAPEEFDRFTLVYTGSFYEGWIEPYAFLEGVAEYVESFDDDVGVVFYGEWDDDYDAHVEKLGIEDHVEYRGFVDHELLVPPLKGADVAVHVGGTDPKNAESTPLKLWDYLGSETPILSVVDPSFRAASLIEDHDFGLAVSPDDPTAIAEAIQRLRDGEAGQGVHDPERTGKFRRERNLAAFLDVLEGVYENR